LKQLLTLLLTLLLSLLLTLLLTLLLWLSLVAPHSCCWQQKQCLLQHPAGWLLQLLQTDQQGQRHCCQPWPLLLLLLALPASQSPQKVLARGAACRCCCLLCC
jgi:hypothetical protein